MKQVVVFLLLFITVTVKSQIGLKNKFEFLEVGLFIHSVSLPFKASNGFAKLNRWPGIRLGTSIPLNDASVGLSYRPSLSFYHQKKLHYGLHFNNQFAFVYPQGKKITPEILGGIGYLHTYEDAPLFKVEQGKVAQKRDWGRSQFTVSLGIGFGVNISKKTGLMTFVQQEILLQFPFAPKGGITTIIHNRTHLSIRKYF